MYLAKWIEHINSPWFFSSNKYGKIPSSSLTRLGDFYSTLMQQSKAFFLIYLESLFTSENTLWKRSCVILLSAISENVFKAKETIKKLLSCYISIRIRFVAIIKTSLFSDRKSVNPKYPIILILKSS